MLEITLHDPAPLYRRRLNRDPDLTLDLIEYMRVTGRPVSVEEVYWQIVGIDAKTVLPPPPRVLHIKLH